MELIDQGEPTFERMGNKPWYYNKGFPFVKNGVNGLKFTSMEKKINYLSAFLTSYSGHNF